MLNNESIGLFRINTRESYLLEYNNLCQEIDFKKVSDFVKYIYECLEKENCGASLYFHFPMTDIKVYRAAQLYLLLMGHSIEMKMKRYDDPYLQITKINEKSLERNKKKLLKY